MVGVIKTRTNAGRDFTALVLSGSSGATGAAAPANYMALTADSTTPNAGDTTLPGEITVGTLSRHICTYSHTTGQVTYTLQNTFTADQDITIVKMGIFNAAVSGGTMVFESFLNTPAIVVTGDALLVTEQVSL
jgi:hypothetical protein